MPHTVALPHLVSSAQMRGLIHSTCLGKRPPERARALIHSDDIGIDSPANSVELPELSICSTRTGMHELADRFGGGINYALLDFRSLQ